jgi:hypothetical protein
MLPVGVPPLSTLEYAFSQSVFANKIAPYRFNVLATQLLFFSLGLHYLQSFAIFLGLSCAVAWAANRDPVAIFGGDFFFFLFDLKCVLFLNDMEPSSCWCVWRLAHLGMSNWLGMRNDWSWHVDLCVLGLSCVRLGPSVCFFGFVLSPFFSCGLTVQIGTFTLSYMECS